MDGCGSRQRETFRLYHQKQAQTQGECCLCVGLHSPRALLFTLLADFSTDGNILA